MIDSTRRTAGCGPACPVVWQGCAGNRVPYAYCESDHPPASLLADLSRALHTPVEALLKGGAPQRKARPAALSPRLERRLRQIERLSPKPKQQLLSIIDTFIAAEQNRQGPR